MRISRSDFLSAARPRGQPFIAAVLAAAIDHGPEIDIDPETYRALAHKYVVRDLSRPSRGLGDTVAKLTHAVGIAQAIEALGIPCRCPERQEALNRAVPYK